MSNSLQLVKMLGKLPTLNLLTPTFAQYFAVVASILILNGCVHDLTKESDLRVSQVMWSPPGVSSSVGKPMCTPQKLGSISPNQQKDKSKNRCEIGNTILQPILLADSNYISNGSKLDLDGLILYKDKASFDKSEKSAEKNPWFGHPSTKWTTTAADGYSNAKNFINDCLTKGVVSGLNNSNGRYELDVNLEFDSPLSRDGKQVTSKWMRQCDCLTTVDERYRKCFADRVVGLISNLHHACKDKDTRKKLKCDVSLDKDKDDETSLLYMPATTVHKMSKSVFTPTLSYEAYLQRQRGIRAGYGIIGERILPGESICFHSSNSSSNFDKNTYNHTNSRSIDGSYCYQVDFSLPLSFQDAPSLSVDPLGGWYPLNSIKVWLHKPDEPLSTFRKASPVSPAHNLISEPDSIGRLGIFNFEKLSIDTTISQNIEAMYLVRQLPLRLQEESILRVIDHKKLNDPETTSIRHSSSLLTAADSGRIDVIVDRMGTTKDSYGNCTAQMSIISKIDELYNGEKVNWKDIDGCDIDAKDYKQVGYNLLPAQNDPYVSYYIKVNNKPELIRTGTTLLHILRRHHSFPLSTLGITYNANDFFYLQRMNGSLVLKRVGNSREIYIKPASSTSLHDLMIPLLPGDEISWKH